MCVYVYIYFSECVPRSPSQYAAPWNQAMKSPPTAPPGRPVCVCVRARACVCVRARACARSCVCVILPRRPVRVYVRE